MRESAPSLVSETTGRYQVAPQASHCPDHHHLGNAYHGKGKTERVTALVDPGHSHTDEITLQGR